MNEVKFNIKESPLEDQTSRFITINLKRDLNRFVQRTVLYKAEVQFYLVPVEEIDSLSLAYNSFLLYQACSKATTPAGVRACLDFLKDKYNNGLLISRRNLPREIKDVMISLNVKYHIEDGNMSHLHDKFELSMLYDLVLYKVLKEYNRHKSVIDPNHLPRTYLGFLTFDLV